VCLVLSFHIVHCVAWLEILAAQWFVHGYIKPDVTPWDVGIAFTRFNRNAYQTMYTSDESDRDRWDLLRVRGTVLGSNAHKDDISAWFAGFAFQTWESCNNF
jgi:hypothetical protein